MNSVHFKNNVQKNREELVMKTVFIYDSKYGGTKEIVTNIAKLFNHPVTILSVEEKNTIQLSNFNQIIFCAPAYAGQLRKDSKVFLEKNQSALLNKRLFLVNTGIQFEDSRIQTQIETVFPKELRDHAELTIFAGAVASINKMNFFERMILKKIFKDQQVSFDPKTEYRCLKQEAIDLLLEKANAKMITD